MSISTTYELIVVGGGAGGIGTALAAARFGVRTLLIEAQPELGGTATLGGVHCWEPSVSGTGIAQDIFARLTQIPQAVGIYSFGHHCCWPTPGAPIFPGGQCVIDPSRQYHDTLRRYGSRGMGGDEGFVRAHWHGVPFEPEAYARVVRELLAETGCCDVWTNATVNAADGADGVVKSLICFHHGQSVKVSGTCVVDCTGDAKICAALGCTMMRGAEGQDDFGEPDAPLHASEEMNAISLIYRVTRDHAQWMPVPAVILANCWWRDACPAASVVEYPNGDWNINMLPTMEAREFQQMPYHDAYAECTRRVWAHWRWMQEQWPGLRAYGLRWIAPRLGVREGARVMGEYVLTEHDLLAGISAQPHADIIAIADHPIDLHGSVHGGGCRELGEPYGIPFRCLIPKGWGNLLVACRGASFSHLGAASSRLTRTMLQLGQAAGTAVGLAKRCGVLPRDVTTAQLRQSLRDQGVNLDYRDLP